MGFSKKINLSSFRILRILLVVVIFILLAFFSYRDFQKISQIKIDWQVEYLMASIFFLLVGLVFQVWVWQANLRVTGAQISFKQSFKLYYLANVGRYIPGKIWSILGFVHLGRKADLAASQTLGGVVIGLFSSLVSGFFLGGIFIWIAGVGQLKINFWMPVLLVGGGLASLHPAVSNRVLGFITKITNRQVKPYPYTYIQILHLTGLYGLVWLFYSASFAFLVLTFVGLSSGDFLYSLGVFPISYGIGYLALFSPAGWGVREGGISLLLSQIMPTYLAVAVALGSRLVLTITESFFFAVALKLKWRRT